VHKNEEEMISQIIDEFKSHFGASHLPHRRVENNNRPSLDEQSREALEKIL
jgi:hypothetical protein